MTRRHVAAQR